jgi:hypothetical protein
MSLKVGKDEIFFVLPESRYSVSTRIDGYMDEDFSLCIKAKVIKELLTDKEVFIFSRNGKHAGISAFIDSLGNTVIVFTYWFVSADGLEEKVKQVFHTLKEHEQNEFNELVMICDNFEERKIHCYVNGEKSGEILFESDEKLSYKNSFYWFGCGSMIGPEEHQSIGNFEFDLAFICPVKLNISEVIDLIDNYDLLYSIDVFNGMRKLKREIQKKYNFAFFCDFKNYNRYKVWDLSFSGNYPQFYIEDNIYF